jgi:hypothetical protein
LLFEIDLNNGSIIFLMKRYNIINNSLGWLCFVVAAVTYLLTLEPTASFWDCPEFISQGYKLEVGHPPGNPIFMLAARFFVNFAGGDPTKVAVMVNAMSALLSAGTILLLFWTITHLVRRLMVGRSNVELSLPATITVMACGLCGALAYTWSDTFWFSAVEGEVYAFSSFCTALVVWLILKWDNRADDPHSDRYLILIAYVIGISIAVHLLNLLTIPALALVVYFRKVKNTTMWRTLGALLCSFVVIALILYGLVPGFIGNAQWFELFFVNVLGFSYNIGVLIYALLLVGVLIWCVRSLYSQKSRWQIQVSFVLSVILSGIPFIGSSWWLPTLLIIALCAYIFFGRRLNVRILNIVALSILVIFAGYSSYALLLIRSHANPPMNQNSPDNVFALGSYLNREQYGETPLLYGPSFASQPKGVVDINTGAIEYITVEGNPQYAKVAKTDPSEPDRYVKLKGKESYDMTPNMIFPRMYSQLPGHPEGYLNWIGETMESLPTTSEQPYYQRTSSGDLKPLTVNGMQYTEDIPHPTLGQNIRYFLNYQLGHMYWRYFMWNFAGRQNDLQNSRGELTRGNWISGISFIDNARLGDQSLLPDDLGEGNKGHNVFYMLPLLMGLLGIVLQMLRGMEGVRQFWVVFLLFFMTGIAIVLYLNQPPNQPRERDYAFAGSFYAFAIWIGMGVYMVWKLLKWALKADKAKDSRRSLVASIIAAVVALAVPLQMVSQTWDDHDRSGRYTTRDFGMNYLSSLDENAIIFTNGDNDTFPLWYAQEVEGYRTDVRVVNLAYLTTDWYVNQMRVPSYEAKGIAMQAEPLDYAYDRLQQSYILSDEEQTAPVNVTDALRDLYKSPDAVVMDRFRKLRYPLMYIPANVKAAQAKGVISPSQAAQASDAIIVDLSKASAITLSEAISLDMISTGINNGWNRPAYFAMTVPDDYYLNLSSYLRNTGLTYQVTPVKDPEYDPRKGVISVSTDKMYDNVMNKFRWGGLDSGRDLYLDETVRRMVTTHRSALLDLVSSLYNEGITLLYGDGDVASTDPAVVAKANERFNKAVNVLNLMEKKIPAKVAPYAIQIGQHIADAYYMLGEALSRDDLMARGRAMLHAEILRYAPYVPYYSSLLNDETRARAAESPVAALQVKQKPLSVVNLNLSSTDIYVPQYLYGLIQDYYQSEGDIDRLQDELDHLNVNLADLELLLSY